MSVAPDLLLQSAPDARMKAAVAKAPVKTDDTRRSEASSFADVYAKERQTKSAERSDAAKSRAEKTADSQPGEDPGVEAEPAVADSGKALPSERAVDEAAPAEESLQGDQPIDPLVLMGLVPLPAVPAAAPEPAVEAPLPGIAGVDLGAVPIAVPLAGEALPAAADSALLAPGLTLPDEFQAAQAAVAQQAKPASGQAVDAELAKAPLDPALAAPLLEQLPADGEAVVALELDELDTDTGDAKDAIGELRAESFANKLNSLNQTLAQQVGAAQRSTLVPGQPVPMQQSGWTEAVVDRVMWLSSQNLKSAEIQLDPQDLGRLDVKISLNQEQTQIAFASPHAAVREALEGQMNRLRDMFAQQGMNLSEVNVSDQSLARGWQGQGSEGQGRGGSSSRGGSAAGDAEVVIGSVEVSGTPKTGRGLVDYYA
jgi:flagellar hook-length control protein FliK